MLSEQDPVLQSVLKITECQTKNSLTKELVANLGNLARYRGLVLLQVPADSGADYMEVVMSIPNQAPRDFFDRLWLKQGLVCVKRDTDMTRCIQSGEIIVQVERDLSRMLFPIIINGKIAQVLDVHGCHPSTEMAANISAVLAICSNFIAVLDANEHDTLTGLLNRKTFDAQFTELLSHIDDQKIIVDVPDHERRSKKSNLYHWVGMLDIDHFKKINDSHGHVLGDEVLILVANLLKKSFRNNDLLFRYGGEEFVIVLAPLYESEAMIAFDRFRMSLEAFEFPQVGRVTASIGTVNIDKREHQSMILEKADRALYYAKGDGRNKVCSYHYLIDQGELCPQEFSGDVEIFDTKISD
ncbi:MAG: GGDEF domain-containing protein [Immundisolibacteraceae bacterium]|nr:GGDEF domain-containing protein [Immundisolibacteraceae bacterium]